jgi:hypothetical protein
MQIYNKFAVLKSKQSGKYVCFQYNLGNFILKVSRDNFECAFKLIKL